MRKNFINLIERSVYKNIYIFNLVDNFLKYINLSPIVSIGTHHIIILFNHFFKAISKSYTVYMDTGSHFTSQKLYIYFQKKAIMVVFTFSTSYKPVSLLQDSHHILQQTFKNI